MDERKRLETDLATLKRISEQLWDVHKKLDHIIETVRDANEFKGLRGSGQ